MSPVRLSRLEVAPRIVLNFSDAFNRHDVPAMLQCLTAECVFEVAVPAPAGVVLLGQVAIARYWEDFFRVSPVAQMEIEEIFGLGLRCVKRWRLRGAEAPGWPPVVRGVDVCQVRMGLICEIFSYLKGSL